jgi:hypothetical protein
MAILFDILLGVARDSGMLREGIATGGSTTTILDSVGRTEDNGVFNDGTAFVVYDAGGGGVAPENQSKLVTDFGKTGGIITTQAFSAAVVVNDYYGVMNKRYPRWALIQSVNESLRDIGRVGTVDSTTLDTAASKREYNLPVVAKYDGQISDYVPRQRLIAETLMRLYRWRLIKVGSSNATAVQLFNEASAKLERIKRLYPIHEPEKLPQLWMENKPYTTIETNV